MFDLRLGDCLEVMADIPDGSVDMVLTDPPYFRAKNERWDKSWPDSRQFAEWVQSCAKEYTRILKPSGASVIFSKQRLSHRVAVAIEGAGLTVETNGVWIKDDAGGAEKGVKARSTRSPADKTERFIVARASNPIGKALKDAMRKSGLSYSQVNMKVKGSKSGLVSNWVAEKERWGSCTPSAPDWVEAMRYCGESVSEADYWALSYKFNHGACDYDVVSVRRERGLKLHPTQKPVALMEYLIRTYTNEGETVLDFTMGSGTTGVACSNTGRRFIGIELDPGYFEIARTRIEQAHQAKAA